MKNGLLQRVLCGMCAFAPPAIIHTASLAITSVTSSETSKSSATPTTVVESMARILKLKEQTTSALLRRSSVRSAP
jgi:hypothetical protein